MKFFILFLGVLGGLQAFASPTFHVSDMSRDVQIRNALYRALQESYGKVPGVQKSGEEYSLEFGKDLLRCGSSGCHFNWDLQSSDWIKNSMAFQKALYDVLFYWSQSGGLSEPILHKFTYTRTGTIRISLDEEVYSQDHVTCELLKTVNEAKQCHLVISEMVAGTDSDLQKIYESLLAKPSLMEEQKQALLASVKSDKYLGPESHDYNNGLYEVVHTVNTDFVIDSFEVSAYYAYKTPLKNHWGIVFSNGTKLTAVGSQDQAGYFSLQEMTAASYVLAHRPR